MKKGIRAILSHPVLLLAALFLFGFTAADFLTPAKTRSELENRYLKQKPDFSWKAVFAKDDQNYMTKYSDYVNDQFVLRDLWISTKSVGEFGLGKIENNGITYGKDHYLFEKVLTVNEKNLKDNIQYVREFVEMYPQIEIDFTILPNSYNILADKVPKGLPSVDQDAVIEKIYEAIGDAPNLRIQNLDDSLRQHTQDYIFYRTDHHWTTYGAYLAYRDYMDSLGRRAVEWDQLSGQEEPGFYGTYFNKAKLFNAVPDIITWFDMEPLEVTINGKAADGIYDFEKFDTRDKYAAFLRGNNGLTVIKSGHNLNHQEGETSRILLFKDSYGNSFSPFLTYSYDEVYIVDLRYWPMSDSMAEFLKGTEFDNVLIMYNYMNFVSDTFISKLRR